MKYCLKSMTKINLLKIFEAIPRVDKAWVSSNREKSRVENIKISVGFSKKGILLLCNDISK